MTHRTTTTSIFFSLLPDHPDQCLMSPFASSNSAASRLASNGLGTPEVYKVGEVVQLQDTCGVVTCTDEGEYLMLHYTG